MERSKSHFPSVKLKKTASSPDGSPEIALRERTTSLGAALKKQKSKKMVETQSCTERLQVLYLRLPKDLDVEKMKETIAEGERSGVDRDFLERCRGNLREAEKIVARKKEKERLAVLEQRCEKVTEELQKLLEFELLEVDMGALKKALDEMTELEEALNSPHKVEAELAARCHQFLTDAEAAHEKRRKFARDRLKKASSSKLLVDAETLRQAVTDAQAAGVEKAALSDGHNLLGLAEKRRAATEKLTRLTGSSDASEVDLKELRKAWEAAAKAATPAATLKFTQLKIRSFEESQVPKSVASARLSKLVSGAGGGNVGSIDQDEMREAQNTAEELGVESSLLGKARDVLAEAARAQMLRDVATASLLVHAAPRQPERSDMTHLRDLVPKAAQAGVSEEVVTMAKASLKEAEAAQAQHLEDTREQHIERLKSANARTAESAPTRMEGAKEASEEAERALQAAVDKVAEEKAAVDAATTAASEALSKVVEADVAVQNLAGDDGEAEAWENDESLRSDALAAEAALREARTSLEAAMVLEADARWQYSKAQRTAEAAKAIADVVGGTAEGLTSSDVGLIGLKPPGGGGGCCSGGKKGDVYEPATADGEEPAKPLKPLPIVIDEIAWSPLNLPAGSEHQVELLLSFALGGIYANSAVCGAVAAAICQADPTYESSSAFVLGLSDAFEAGRIRLTAGGKGKRVSRLPGFLGGGGGGGGGGARNSARLSHGDGGGSTDELKRSSSSFLQRMTSFGSKSAGGAGGDDAAIQKWPGRDVHSEISQATFQRMVEVWLAKMARGSQAAKSKGRQEPLKKKKKKGQGAFAGKLSATISKLMKPPHAERLAELDFNNVLKALLERHYEVTNGRADDGDAADEEAMEAAAALADVHACIEVILGAAMRSPEAFDKLMPLWLGDEEGGVFYTPPPKTDLKPKEVKTEKVLIVKKDAPEDRIGVSFNKDDKTGIIKVSDVAKDGRGAKAGLAVGVVVKSVNGREPKDAVHTTDLLKAASGEIKVAVEVISYIEPPTPKAVITASPAAALAGMSRAFAEKLESGAALAEEKVVLALLRLFVQKPESLTGFQQLVPKVFDDYLKIGKPLRSQMCEMLKEAKFEGALVDRLREDDELARQPFFWSAPGMKLFGGNVKDIASLKPILAEAISQQAVIASAFLEQAIREAETDAAQREALPELVKTILECLLDHVKAEGGADKVRRGVLLAVDTILYASATHSSALFAKVAPSALEAWSSSDWSTNLLDHYVDTHLQPRLDLLLKKKEETAAAAAAGVGNDEGGEDRCEAIVQTLCSLFIAKPDTLSAFLKLVPKVFQTLLILGSEARTRVNAVLMSGSFEPKLAHLIAESDDFVTSSFFWAADGAMNLCLSATVAKSFAKMNSATLTGKDGKEVHLFSRLLALLLRLSSHRGGEVGEIAFRVREVLDQFERNPDQQQFMLTIIEKLDERSLAAPADFDEIDLTVLSEVAQNGVQTISSVSGEGLSLCEQAMTTLLKTYIANRKPSEWKGLFKEATNIAFMVKYMFRESLDIAKQKFSESVGRKGANFSGDAHEVVSTLVKDTLFAYGEVGIYDPERLAEIDFLNHPEELVELVSQSKNRQSRAQKKDMQLLTEVTTQWMQLMVDKKYPPLTPHHTQAFTVLMMAKFFEMHLLNPDAHTPRTKKRATKYKSFIAQLSTGEGKSIVIAMLAIFMVKLYGVRVHVLENNQGLLQRDYAQNKPFYDKFGIKSGYNLDEDETQIVYCLKDAINRRFLRKLVEGKLDQELGATVLIVDEVDDLIVNERPNSHYVKKDAERSPALQQCYKTLKEGNRVKPDGAEEEVWQYACAVADFCSQKEQDKHYRVVQTRGGGQAVMMLDADGNLPKVALTAPWLAYLNYTLCGVEPFSETRHACVCTPYIFNKYKGIFGLTGSVGGKAELKYLSQTYKAIKFDVPRFLDTCTGNARKEVTNHGVEILKSEKEQIARVCEIAGQYFRKVPVLVIASSLGQLQRIYEALKSGQGAAAAIPSDEVQRFAQFSVDGRSLAREWQTIIDDSTKRLGSQEDNRCRVTVTDKFGGRGHDFQVIDKEANANGGMLVIATSIPDEREWIQWRGRTARQDRPGQFYVVLDEGAKPFNDPKKKNLKDKLLRLPDENAKVEMLLEVSDEGIGEKLKAFELEQSQGEKLNELTERYYKSKPRGYDDPWPIEQHKETDSVLRKFLTSYVEKPPKEIVQLAKAELGIELES